VSVPTPFPTSSSAPTVGPTPPPTPSPIAFPTAEGTLDRYEIRAVGEEDGKPYGQVISLDPLVGYGYFEAHPLQVAERGSITLEIFANVPDDEEDCDNGVLVESVPADNFIIGVDSTPFPGYNEMYKDIEGKSYPATTNGKVGSSEFSISDFRYPKGDKQIYFPNRGGDGNQDGTVEFCLRLSIKKDYTRDGQLEYVSYIDTRYKIDIDLTANFESFSDQVVQIYANRPTDFDTEVVATIDVDTFVCDDDNSRVPDTKSYGIGQDFRICVGPSDDADENYEVEKFVEVKCGNAGEKRTLVDNFQVDPLTSIDVNSDSNGVLGVNSVVTSGYISNGDEQFTCSGQVALKYNNGRRILNVNNGLRRTNANDDLFKPQTELASTGITELQYKESSLPAESLSPFKMTINIDIPNDESSATAPSSPVSIHNFSAKSTAAAAAVGLVTIMFAFITN
jgi:hypothetical protein